MADDDNREVVALAALSERKNAFMKALEKSKQVEKKKGPVFKVEHGILEASFRDLDVEQEEMSELSKEVSTKDSYQESMRSFQASFKFFESNANELGLEFEKTREEIKREETETKSKVASLLAVFQTSTKQQPETANTIAAEPFDLVQKRYLDAVENLRPKELEPQRYEGPAQTAINNLKQDYAEEAHKIQNFGALQDRWQEYDSAADDTRWYEWCATEQVAMPSRSDSVQQIGETIGEEERVHDTEKAYGKQKVTEEDLLSKKVQASESTTPESDDDSVVDEDMAKWKEEARRFKEILAREEKIVQTAEQIAHKEEEIASQWIDFTEKVVQAAEKIISESDDDLSIDEDMVKWKEEARRMKIDAARRKQRKEAMLERRKKRKEIVLRKQEDSVFDNSGEQDDRIPWHSRLKKHAPERHLTADEPSDRVQEASVGGEDSENDIDDEEETAKADDKKDRKEKKKKKKEKEKEKKDAKDTKTKKKEKKEKGDAVKTPATPTTPKVERQPALEKKGDTFKIPTIPTTPKVERQAPSEDDDDMNDGPEEKNPRNLDGSPWKNPLKFWTNKPKKLNETGAKYIFKPLPKSDCFRKTEISASDSASFYWVKAEGDFDVIVKIKGNFRTIYDKAGIMIRDDEKNWILSGVEFFNGALNHSTSVTKGVSDWSLAPVPAEAKDGLWICVKRADAKVTCYFSVDARKWVQTRQAVFPSPPGVKVGVVAACPMGEPYKVVFERFIIKNQTLL